jgi:hypothetical protein
VALAPLAEGAIHFDRVSSWSVKSRRQSELLAAWLNMRTTLDRIPSVTDLGGAIRGYPEQTELTVFDLVNDGPSPRYRIRSGGAAIKKALGLPVAGHCLDEVLPPAVWDKMRTAYDACVEAKLPVYAAFSVPQTGQTELHERLLLPLGLEGGGGVTGLLSTLKTTGWVEAGGIAKADVPPEAHYSFRAIITLD